ncbi:unnamed protein product [Rhodiola kirilowii]
MAIVLAIPKWRPYLLGRHFIVGRESKAADALSRKLEENSADLGSTQLSTEEMRTKDPGPNISAQVAQLGVRHFSTGLDQLKAPAPQGPAHMTPALDQSPLKDLAH